MDFRLTEDQRNLRDAIRDFLTAEHGPEVLRRLDTGDGRDASIWQGLVEMGLTGLLVPEAEGGLGMGAIEAALVAVELGRANVSEPVADTALIAVPFLDADRRSAVALGDLKVALAHPVNPWVADLATADLVLDGSGAKPPHADPRAIESVDPLRRLCAPVACTPSDELLDRAALMTAGQLIGGAERMLALATDYAGTRQQFGKPIGSFQAVKHHLANVAVKLEFARPVLWRAAYAVQHCHPRASIHISHAKIAAGDAALLAAETAIQVHGAMGYTYEVDLHFWMKRAWALIGAWGDRGFHFDRIDQAIIGDVLSISPDQTFESGLHHG